MRFNSVIHGKWNKYGLYDGRFRTKLATPVGYEQTSSLLTVYTPNTDGFTEILDSGVQVSLDGEMRTCWPLVQDQFCVHSEYVTGPATINALDPYLLVCWCSSAWKCRSFLHTHNFTGRVQMIWRRTCKFGYSLGGLVHSNLSTLRMYAHAKDGNEEMGNLRQGSTWRR
jgi:hypothetical protein